MVRFIIYCVKRGRSRTKIIYIPIWLDLLSGNVEVISGEIFNLHSNMVRFIINFLMNLFNKIFEIYIPIWLDLLFFKRRDMSKKLMNLHSNMVRFIILVIDISTPKTLRFTFQYG